MSTTGGARRRGRGESPDHRRGESAGHRLGSDASVPSRPRRARGRRRAVTLLVASLALLVPIGLQIHRAVADQAMTAQTMAKQAAADQVAVNQAAAVLPTKAGSAVPRQKASTPPIKKATTTKAEPAPIPVTPALVAGIDPALSRALSAARIGALRVGLQINITSGFRTAAEQQRLYDEAVARYGSPEQARHWVLPPAESDHVKGLAIDVGPPGSAAWLEKHGVLYGLCRRYVNEWWHFERLAPNVGQRCPAMEPYAGG
jgi:zinc D-Ala-D-Ala carboxypeptidase